MTRFERRVTAAVFQCVAPEVLPRRISIEERTRRAEEMMVEAEVSSSVGRGASKSLFWVGGA